MLPLYALVAYVRSPVGKFAEELRRDLHPQFPALPAHITVLPPRPLQGSVEGAKQLIQEVCRNVTPFEIEMGDVETFAPATPTVFIRVAHAGYRMRELHDKLNTGPLQYDEPWPYMPHMTIIKLPEGSHPYEGAATARRRWREFCGSRKVRVDEVTFVHEGATQYSWVDLAAVALGK